MHKRYTTKSDSLQGLIAFKAPANTVQTKRSLFRNTSSTLQKRYRRAVLQLRTKQPRASQPHGSLKNADVDSLIQRLKID